MFEALMTTVKSNVISAEFRSATATRMQRLMAAMSQPAFETNADDSAVEDPAFAGTLPPPAEPEPPSGETVADVFASMMSQAGRAAFQSAPARPAAPAGRNDPCPCGSGKKYKKCCGRAMA